MRRFYVIFTSAIIFFANSISQATVNVDPMEIETEINSGETEDHEIIISHDGGADLDFTVTTEIISEAVNDDAMRDGPRRDERSDPDNFGYIWRDDAEALVVYDWIDITEIGERLRNVGDDWNSGSLDMGWTFDFYGQEFNSIRVCSNGFASFTSASTSYSPFHLPRRAQPYDLLAVQWLDLNPADGGYIYFYTDAEEEITILSWIDVPRYGAGGGDRQTFQLVLSGNGVIKYQYADDNVPGANSCIGIQNGNGRDGLSIHWGAEDGGPAERAYVIMPSWIQVDPVDGTIPRGEEVNLTITLDATYLIEGDYEADVHILTGDPDTPDVVVEIFMFVDGEPSIEVLWDDDLGCPDMIDWNAGDVFPDLFVGEPYDVEITVRNRGTAVLNIDEIVSDHDYFILDQEDMVLGPREKTMLTVTFQAEETGEVNGSLTLSSDDPEMETVEIDLTGETFDPPIIDVEPTSITRKLDIDETTEANLTIINNGAESKLSFETEVEIISEPNGAPEMMGRRDNIPQAPLRPFYVREVVSIPDDRIQFAVKAKTASIKQMKIWDQYQADLQRIEDQPRRDNQGGMDSYGYLWRDDEEGMVDYEWIDISGTGDRMNNVADDWNSGSLDMGWTFSFYGEEFSSIRICSNGFASFTSASTSYQPFQVPNEAEPYNLLAPQWVDLDPSRGGAIYFYTDADEEMTVISWDNIPGYGGGTRQTFQLIISGDGSIKFQYGDDNNAGRNTSIGIQNGDGTDGLSIHYGSEDAGPDGRAYRIMRSWVRLDPVAAEIDPNDEMDVTVVLDATNLIEGLYEADVNIVSNDIENPRITVNVKLEVGSGPGIDVQPESIDFGDVLIGEAGHQKVTITNISLVDLEIDRIEIDGGGFSHNHTGADNFVLEPEETRCLIVNFNPEDTQNYNSELTIFSDDGEQPEATIQLTGQGITPPPEIYLGYLPDEDPGISFAEHVITENFDGAKDICMVDLDADGDMDMLGAAGVADDIAWWENDGSENFTRRMISGNFDGAVSVCWKDLDRDGDIDILGAAQDADDITWWENDGNQSFTAHTIAGEFDGASSVFTTDVDGDGDIDVLGAAFDADDITWWENDGNESFTEHTIQGDFDGASSVSAIDLDGDGDIDVLGTATEADDITWWENNGDKSFSAHTIQGNFDGACSVYPMDVNDDGDMDIVGAALNANDITWWENNGSESFSAHTIDGDFDGASSVYAIDFDMDDDVDIIGAAQDANKITWWENDGDENFTERPIGTDFYGASSVKGGDLDNHGDNDILGVAQESDAVTWWENSHVFGNDFGEIEKDSTGIWTFIIFNHGAQTLNVSDIQSNNNVFSTDFGGNANIDQGASLEIEVTFTPDDYAVFDGILEVQSNDPDEGTVSVSLTGEGIFVNYPPVVENPISDFELDEDFDPFVIADLDTVFLDVNDEDLTYYAESDHNEVAVEIVSGSQLRIDSSEDNWYGSVEITVNADDGYDGGGGSPRNDSGPIRQLRQIGHRQVDDSMISAFALNTTDIRPVSSAAQSLPVSRGNEWMGESTDFNPGYLARRDDATDMVFNVQINPVNDPPQWDDIPDSAEVNEVEELSFTVEGSDLDGDDVTFDAVSGDLPDGWEFNDNGDGSGTFTWTPSYDDSGEYTATFTVSDAEYDVDEDVIITVNHVNRPPVLTAIGDKEVNENSELAFTLEATDPDGDGYTFSDDGLPDGASLNGADFSWTPDFDQSGTYDVTFIVTDDGAGALTDEETITITVNHTNRNPVLTAIGNKEVNENEELTFTLEASDPDGDGYTFSDNGLPTGASLDGADFSWTPDFDQSGNYDVTFIVTDDGAGALTDEETITITVNHVNRSPVWDNVPESAEGDEAEEISFHVEASDPDSDDLTVDASSDDLPDGWDFTDNGDGTGAFSWTPGYDDAGEYTLTVTVSDAEFDVAEDVAIIVNHVNRTPVWDSVPENVAVNESAGLSFTVRASDPDDDDLAVDASSDDLPGGWNFSDNNDGSGRFSWTPTYNDAGEYTLTVSVSDDEFTVEEDITITVNDVNRSPVWEYVPENVEGNENAALSFTVNSTDPDNDDLTVNASSDDLPDGWNFTDNYDGTGRFVWTPGFDDSGEYTLTVMVSDGEYNVDEAVTITINHVNRQPIWESAPEDQTIDEDQELSFTVEASDPDGDDLTVDASSDDLPDGWDFTDNGDGTASFIWTPSYEDAGEYSLTITVSDARLELESTMTISVNHVNRTPVWDDVPESVTVDERETFELIVIASDPDVDELTLTASSDDLPDGWQFTDYGNNRGSFRWRPTYNDAGEYNVTFSVTDGEFEVDAEVTVTVNNVNRTPIWDDMPQSINIAENELLEFTVQGSDPDNDDLTINYSSEDIPEEADFTDNENGTGTFSWRPAYDEAGAYHALFTLSDGSLIAEAEVIITVGEVNRPPDWDNVPENVEIDETAELTVTVEGSDPDDDTVTIEYSSEDIPEAAEFTDNEDGTGVLTWTPTYDDAGEYTATFTISDEEFSVETSVAITVNHVNRTPVWDDVPEAVSVDENSQLEFSVNASDPDGDNITLDASSEDLPGGWNFTDNGDGTGTFTWTPSYEDEGEYSVALTVSDEDFDNTTDVPITVNHVNRTPVWNNVPDQVSVNENQQLQFSVQGSDPDGDEITINASSEDIPEGWSFTDNDDGTGTFRWTPGFEDSGDYTATFALSDGEYSVEESVTIQVNHVNRQPEWTYVPETEEVNESDELQFTVQAADPDGDNLTIHASSNDLPEGWEFRDNGDRTGTFSWTPGFEDSGEYGLTLTVSDAEFDVAEEVAINVVHVNRTPVWAYIPESVEIDEVEVSEFTVEASDPDGDDLTIQASSDDLPEGWEFTDNNNGTGDFSWTPTYDDAGEYTLTVTVSDDQFDVSEDIVVTVNHVNRTPAWESAPGSVETDENQALEFTVTASDPDNDNLAFNASSENLPDGWEFTDNEDGSGDFSWTPDYDDAGEYSLVLVLSDGEFQLQRTITITVNDVNRAPVWTLIPEIEEVDEAAELIFNVEAEDPDGDDVIIVASSDDLPDTWEFTDNENGTGSFTWTPGYNDSGEYTVTFSVTDFSFNVAQDVTIRANHVNRSPAWENAPESVQTDEMEELAFTVQASDPDGDDLTIEASSDDLPQGWEFTDNGDRTAAFNWTPTYDDAGEYTLLVTASDGDIQIQSSITVTINQVNRTPVWIDIPESVEGDEAHELSFTVEASDPDGDNLTLDASSDDLSNGWEFTDNDDGTGTFNWTPGYDDSGQYTATFTATDGEFSIQADVTITINHVNREPEWVNMPDAVQINENQLLEFTVTASDPDGDNLSINANSDDLPEGWEFNDNDDNTGAFSWMPSYNDAGEYSLVVVVSDGEYQAQSTITITVNNTNRRPVWTDLPGSETVDEADELSFNVEASDPDGDNLTLDASSDDLPEGWEFTDNGDGTGTFNWTCSYDDAGEYTLTVTGTDGELNIEGYVTITVYPVNRSPVWDNVPESVDGYEDESLVINVVSSDPDGDNLVLQATSEDLPDGWTFNYTRAGRGTFSWTPNFNDAGEYNLDITTSDGEYLVEASVSITVNDVNRAPAWINLTKNYEINEAEELSFTATATDPDGDDFTLSASSENLPDGWEFTDNEDGTGVFNWTPGYDDEGTYRFELIVSDAEFDISEEVEIVVGNINRAPFWSDNPESVGLDEAEEFQLVLEAVDPDGDDLTIEASSDDLPEGWDFTDNDDGTGTFDWTPSYDDEGEYTLTVTVSDTEFEITDDIGITVSHVNRTPVWTVIPESREVNETSMLTINVTASDPDDDELELSASSDDLPDGWQFVDHADGRGAFTWRPSYDDAGEYTLLVTASDGDYAVQEDVSITVNHVNRRPVWDNVPQSRNVMENELCEFTVIGHDLDEDDLTVTYSSEDLSGEEINFSDNNDGTADFSWRPGDDDSGSYVVLFTISDYEFDISGEVVISVGDVNRSPIWDEIPENVEVDEAQELSFTVVASDPDDDELTIEANSEDLPDGWEFVDHEDGTGTFAWTPGYDDSGQYTVSLTLSDGEFHRTRSVEITVNHVNRTPVWDEIPESVTVNENELLEFTFRGSDPDNDSLIITYSSDNIPESSDFSDNGDGTGAFSWRPTFDEVGEYNAIFSLSDGNIIVQAEVVINVYDVNRQPVWESRPESVTVNEEQLLEFTVQASDPDGDDISIEASSEDLPGGWNLTDNGDGTADFEWTPGFDDAGEYSLLLTVSDGVDPLQSRTTITVNQVNREPDWVDLTKSYNVNESEELSFTIEASDPDGDNLNLSAFSNDLPEEYEFTDHGDGTADFSWTPTYDDGGDYILEVTVSDAEFEITEEISITVNEINRTPDWTDIPESVDIDEQEFLSFTVEASDPDDDELSISCNSENLPDGWQFRDHGNGSGTFRWTPTYDDAGAYLAVFTVSDGDFEMDEDVTINVNPVNRQPSWDTVPDSVSVNEAEELSFTLEASDPDGDDLTLEASSDNLPEGWEFTDNGDATGTFVWTPGYEDAGEYSVAFTVSDNEFSIVEQVVVTVNHVNRAPSWVEIPEQIDVSEAEELIFAVRGSDPDDDDLTLSASSGDLPEGWEFTDNNDGTGDFNWTPSFDDAGEYTITVTISDGEFDIDEIVVIVVNQKNRAPTWVNLPESVQINEAEELSFTVQASDPDNDELALDASSEDIPEGWEFTDNGDATGVFTWTPSYDDAGEYTIDLMVSDGEFQPQSAVTITVNHVNRAPVWVEISESVEADEMEELTFTVQASDPDDDDLSINASSDDLPEGWDFTDNEDGTGAFSWTPSYNDAGEYSLVLVVSDGERQLQSSIAITIHNVNRAPVWQNVHESVNVNELQLLSFTVVASDPDRDDININSSSNDLPEGWSFIDHGDGRGTFRWTPTYDDAGEYGLIVTVSDGEFEVEEDVVVVVNHVNRTPGWVDLPESVELNEGEELVLTVEADDPDRDDLTLEAVSDNLPEGWQFTDHTNGRGTFRWTCGYEDAGEYNVNFTVSDEEFNVEETVAITVIDVNRTPVWDDIPQSVSIRENELLEFTVQGSDPDGDELTIDATSNNLPDGWEFNDNGDGTGDFAWRPGQDDSGAFRAVFTLSDAEYDVTAEVIITVGDVNRPPNWDEVPETVEVDEYEQLELVVVGSDPDDDQVTISYSSEDIPEAAEFSDNGNGTAILTWTPDFDDAGEYTAEFIISDEEFDVETSVAVVVINVNRTPVWDDIPESAEVDEDQLLEFTVTGSDPDNNNLNIVFTSDDLPRDADFEDNRDGTGTFSWTPTFADAGEYTAVFTISDAEYDVAAEVTITVGDVNRPPNWDEIPESVEVDENEQLELVVVGSDPDDDQVTISYSSEDIPEAAEFSDNGNGTAIFTWTPDFDDAGEYTAYFTISDEEFDVETSVVIVVNDINRAPEWDDIPQSPSVRENELLEFTVRGSDPDGDELTINATSGNLPDGWDFTDNGDGTGDFSWRPGQDDSGAFRAIFTISDAEYDVAEEVIITVGDVNRPPVWDDAPDVVEINEGSELSFTVHASDPDGDDLSINASSDDLPDGWEFVDNQDRTGSFDWTPGMDDDGEYSLSIVVSDGEYNIETVVAITVTNNNRAPYWDNIPESVEVTEGELLEFEVVAIDYDDDDLRLTAVSDDLPEGWEFMDNFIGTGVFTWQTTLTDEGSYTVTFNVSDGLSVVHAEVSISVHHVNAPPVWEDIPVNAHTDIEQLLEFSVAGSDPDNDDLSINANSDDLPDGWEFTDSGDGTGEFSWTPGNDDEGAYTLTLTLSDGNAAIEHEVTITVGDVNQPPDWVYYPEEIEVTENELLEFTVEGSDPNNDDLTIEVVVNNLPEGWEFADNGDGTGAFEWTPGFEDAGNYSLTLMLSDGEFESEANIGITVHNTNRAPVWSQLPEAVEGHENQTVEFTVTASDPDGNNITFEAYSEDLPVGWDFINNRDGSAYFVWTPEFEYAGDYTLLVSVTDGDAVVSAEVALSVTDVNRPPEWDDVPETVNGEQDNWLEFEVMGSDPDGDDISLEFSSDELPEAASFRDFGNGTGRFNWQPAFDDFGGYTAVFTISDGEYNVDAEVSITITETNRSPHWDEIPQSAHFNIEEEGRFQVVGSDPDSDEITIEVVSGDLPEGWEFTDNGDGTGAFVWTPQANDDGNYTALFTISDGILSDEAQVIITVGDVNQPPAWDEVPETVEIDETSTLEFSVSGSDPDDDAVTIVATSEDLPNGWQFTDNDNGTGDFTWTTDYTHEGVYTLSVTISDDEYDVSTEIGITVNNINRDPVWEAPDQNATITGQEDQELTFNIESSDPDGDDLAVTISDRGGLPRAAHFANNGDGTGTFVWTPGYSDEGSYSPVFVLSDGEVNVTVELSINIQNTNRSPIWDNIPERVEINENQLLEFLIEGSDPDGGELSITGESENLPDGWELTDNNNATGTFSWQPTYNDAGEYLLTVMLSDAESVVESDIVIVVDNTNREPEVISAITNVEIEEDTEVLEIADLDTVFADPDDDELTFEIAEGLNDLNLVINEETNVLTLEPGQDYNGESNVVIIADDGHDQVRLSGAVRFNSIINTSVRDAATRHLRCISNSIKPPQRDAGVEDAFIVTVIPVNDRPFWDEYPEAGIVTGSIADLISFEISADDVDEDELSIEMTDRGGLPEAVEFADNHDGTATFIWQTTLDDEGRFNPVFTVNDAELTAELELTIIISTERDLEISLTGGWSQISLNVSPGERFYTEDDQRGPDTELMCAYAFYDEDEEAWSMIQMKDEHGEFCAPEWNYWGIDFWNLNEGYQLKIDSDKVAVWTGTQIDPQADLFGFDTGWNIIAYYPDYDLPCEFIGDDNEYNYYVLSEIIDYVTIAKDVYGDFCMPEFDYSSMADWTAGQGYQICLNADIEVFNYPVEFENRASLPGRKGKSTSESHWVRPVASGENMSVLVNSVVGLSIDKGDQIAAFNINGDFVGTGMFVNGKCGLAVWGDDPHTTDQIEGLLDDETFKLKLWDADRQVVVDLSAGLVRIGNGLEYKKDGIVVLDVKVDEVTPKEFCLAQNYPNPFNSATRIAYEVPEQSNVLIQVFDLAGRQVTTLVSGEHQTGRYTAVWDAGDVASGIYVISMEASGFTSVRKVMLVK